MSAIEIETLIRENIVLIYAVWLLAFAFVLLVLYWRGKGKILVRIKTPMGEQSKWVKPEPDGKNLVMKKAKGKKAGWTLEFTNKSLIPKRRMFGLVPFFAIDCFFEAEKAIEYDYNLSEEEQYKLTKDQVVDFSRWQSLKARYAQLEKLPLPTVFWLVVILQIATLIFIFLAPRIRF